jgi:hypothetical protein
VFLGEDHVGVTIGRQVASLMPVRDQKRPPGGGIAQYPDGGTAGVLRNRFLFREHAGPGMVRRWLSVRKAICRVRSTRKAPESK